MTRSEMAERLRSAAKELEGDADSAIYPDDVPEIMGFVAGCEAAAVELSKVCEWRANEDGYWETLCHNAFVTEDGVDSVRAQALIVTLNVDK